MSVHRHVLDLYFQDIERVGSDPMSREKEQQEFAALRNGDELARDRIVQANLRFVVRIAKEYDFRGMSLEDVIAYGNMGLLEAIDRFDINMGFKFISYAVWWIRQSIRLALYSNNTVRRPVNASADFFAIEKSARKLQHQRKRAPTTQELVETTGLSEDRIVRAASFSRSDESLDAPAYDDRKSATRLDLLVVDAEQDEADVFEDERIRKALRRLDSRTKFVVVTYYGLEGREAMTLEEIGEKLGLTRERVRQIKEQGLRVMRRNVRLELV